MPDNTLVSLVNDDAAAVKHAVRTAARTCLLAKAVRRRTDLNGLEQAVTNPKCAVDRTLLWDLLARPSDPKDRGVAFSFVAGATHTQQTLARSTGRVTCLPTLPRAI